jgi:small nuclear ribonucleoprotein (snRNP)-like protein
MRGVPDVFRAWRFRRKYVRRQVFVNTSSGVAYEGVLWERSGGFLVLRNVFIHEPRMRPVPIDGEVAIPETNVEFLQYLPSSVREVESGQLRDAG